LSKNVSLKRLTTINRDKDEIVKEDDQFLD